MAGLIGTSISGKNALMPGLKCRLYRFETAEDYIKISFNYPKGYGYNILYTSLKDHQLNDPSIGFISGFKGDVKVYPLNKGTYIKSIKKTINDGIVSIYIKSIQYAHIFFDFVAYTDTYVPTFEKVKDIPDDAVDIY